MIKTIQTNNPFWDKVAPILIVKDRESQGWSTEWEHRSDFCKQYAWAIADPDSIAFVAKYAQGGIVEIGAGMGYWAWQLSQCGVSVQAYDIDPPDNGYNQFHNPQAQSDITTYYPVAQGNCDVLTFFSDRTLFLCWPPYDTSMAAQCLTAYQGKRLIYIGEGDGGCTGDDEFFKRLDEGWELIDQHDIVQWFGTHDYICVYDRKQQEVSCQESGQKTIYRMSTEEL